MASFIDTNVPPHGSLMMSLPIRTQFTTAANEITQLQNRVSVLEQAPSGGDTNWGDITGSIRDQADLYDWLNELQPMLISGQNIATVNGYNLLASGNIQITAEGGGTVTNITAGNGIQTNPPAGITTTGYVSLAPLPTPPPSGPITNATVTVDQYGRVISAVAGAPPGETAPATWGTITGTLASQFDLNEALNARAPLASPNFTGTPQAPTAGAGTNTQQIATTQFVTSAVGAIPTGAPLNSPNFTGIPTAPTATAGTNTTQLATTAFVTGAIGSVGGAPLASPAFTGTPTAPTAPAGTNTTQLATTQFVTAAVTGFAPIASPTFTGTPAGPTAAQSVNSTQLATTAYVRTAINEIPGGGETFTGGQVTSDIQIHTAANPRMDLRMGTSWPTNLANLGEFRFLGNTGSGVWQTGAGIAAQAVGTWDASNRSTQMNIDVMQGTTPRRVQIMSNGSINVGGAPGSTSLATGEINITGIRINGVPLMQWLTLQENPWAE